MSVETSRTSQPGDGDSDDEPADVRLPQRGQRRRSDDLDDDLDDDVVSSDDDDDARRR